MSNENNTPERLALRIQSNTQGNKNLEEAIIAMVRPEASDHVLEIGCGAGKQMRIIAPMVHSMLCLDTSQDLIDVIRESGVPENTRLIKLDMDDAVATLVDQYSLIYSVYALYYSQNVNRLIDGIAKNLLRKNGRFLCVAPDMGNNNQWFEDLETIFSLPEEISQSPSVSRNRILPAMLDTFKATLCSRFENTLLFNNVNDLMKYYDGCAYCPQEKRVQVKRFFACKIAKTGTYSIKKCALFMLGSI
jgi:SAM-dependent methyltransferase